MARKTTESWARYGRRFLLRLSLKRPAEKEVMDEFDRRSALLGKPDKEYLKLCLTVGNQILSAKALSSVSVALSSNESNNTQKNHEGVLPRVSQVETPKETAQPAAEIGPVAKPSDSDEVLSVSEPTPIARAPAPAPADEQADLPVSAKDALGGLMRHG
ncbi:hypothetical protein HBO23_33425 [Pseudomonas sp. WS 5532]|nr:hypothetical protein [Pseudomonas sp. WS 5532]